ncbi:MAG: hypothetical protein ACM3S2_01775 [Ignavibacteriales bacterium]
MKKRKNNNANNNDDLFKTFNLPYSGEYEVKQLKFNVIITYLKNRINA